MKVACELEPQPPKKLHKVTRNVYVQPLDKNSEGTTKGEEYVNESFKKRFIFVSFPQELRARTVAEDHGRPPLPFDPVTSSITAWQEPTTD